MPFDDTNSSASTTPSSVSDIANRNPVNTVATIVGKMIWRSTCACEAPIERALESKSGLTERIPVTVVTITGSTPWVKPNATRLTGPSPKIRITSGSTTTCGKPHISKTNGKKLRRPIVVMPIATPTIAPTITASTNAITISRPAIPSAAATFGSAKSPGSASTTRLGGATNAGSPNQRAATSHSTISPAIVHQRIAVSESGFRATDCTFFHHREHQIEHDRDAENDHDPR